MTMPPNADEPIEAEDFGELEDLAGNAFLVAKNFYERLAWQRANGWSVPPGVTEDMERTVDDLSTARERLAIIRNVFGTGP
jgi:hypothetical protein